MKYFVVITLTALWNRERKAPITWSGICEGTMSNLVRYVQSYFSLSRSHPDRSFYDPIGGNPVYHYTDKYGDISP